ncbi:MAG: F420-dependent NADP oxidoreductase [Opitutus sp.]|nr:F420-dependent NADP oxidoreductase [Opitutus sp.]
MNVAIIGAGNVGSALGRSWAKAGHTIIYGVRNPHGGKTQPPSFAGASSRLIPDAVRAGDVVVLATPWNAIKDVASQLGDTKGRIIVDCTNPLALNSEGSLGLELGSTTSGAEEIQKLLPAAHVVKAFNTYGWENFGNSAYPGYGDLRPVMFHCGDSDEAKEVVAKLAADLGFEPVDTGGLGMARSLEPLALLWIRLAIREGRNPNFVWGRLRRESPATD